MRPLIIDESVKKELAELVRYAELHPFTWQQVCDRSAEVVLIPGNRNEFTVLIPVGFKVVLTIDQNSDKRMMRHASFSVASPGKLPNPGQVAELMKLLGFKNLMQDCYISLKEKDAINIAEYLDGKL